MSWRDTLIGVTVVLLVSLALFSLRPFEQPQIVVQLPKDAAPLEQIAPAVTPISADAKVITQERAVLWWTIYKVTLDKGFSAGYCADQADRAVVAAYGKAAP